MKVYLGLGTNLGDKELNLRVALQKIEERIGKIISLSAFLCYCSLGISVGKQLSECCGGSGDSIVPCRDTGKYSTDRAGNRAFA